MTYNTTDDEFIERRIVTGLIISRDFLQRVRSFWDDAMLESPELRRIARWALDHHEKYDAAPDSDIESIYMEYLKSGQVPKAEAEFIERVLSRLSDDYGRGEQFNSSYLYDQAIAYFRQRSLTRHNDQVQDLIDKGKVEEAEQLAQAYRRPFLLDDEETGLRRGDEITVKPISWLWPGRIPRGKVTILAGNPDIGKSLLATDIAAKVTRAGPWPAGEGKARGGMVLMVSAEDDADDTILPRFLAAGGAPSRIHFLDGVPTRDKDGNRYVAMWNLRDLATLRRHLDGLRYCRLIVIDPISAFMPGVDSHKNADVRSLIAPLAALAAEYKLAVLVVTHLRKGDGPAMEKVIGSLAFVAAARAGFIVAKDQTDPKRRVVAPIKHNLHRKMGALTFTIDEDEKGRPIVLWQDRTVEVDADELVQRQDPEARSMAEEVGDWLREELSEGPVEATTIFEHGKGQGFSKDQIRRAKGRIRARARKGGFEEGWLWELPSSLPSSLSRPSSPSSPSSMGQSHEQDTKPLRRSKFGKLVSLDARRQRHKRENE